MSAAVPRGAEAAGAPGTGDAEHAVRWRLARGHALQLPAVRRARWLRLHEGRLWVTADGRPGEPPPEDWVVDAGGLLRLPVGRPVLAEAWQGASFELLEEAQPA